MQRVFKMGDSILLLTFINLKYCFFLLSWKSVISGEFYLESGTPDDEKGH